MKKEQTVIAAVGSNLSHVAILAGFLVMPAACLDGTAQPGTDMRGATELTDEAVTALSEEMDEIAVLRGEGTAGAAPINTGISSESRRPRLRERCREMLWAGPYAGRALIRGIAPIFP